MGRFGQVEERKNTFSRIKIQNQQKYHLQKTNKIPQPRNGCGVAGRFLVFRPLVGAGTSRAADRRPYISQPTSQRIRRAGACSRRSGIFAGGDRAPPLRILSSVGRHRRGGFHIRLLLLFIIPPSFCLRQKSTSLYKGGLFLSGVDVGFVGADIIRPRVPIRGTENPSPTSSIECESFP